MGIGQSRNGATGKGEPQGVQVGLRLSGNERAAQSAETDRLLFDNLTRLSHAEIDARQLTAVISTIVTRAVRADHAVVCAVAALA